MQKCILILNDLLMIVYSLGCYSLTFPLCLVCINIMWFMFNCGGVYEFYMFYIAPYLTWHILVQPYFLSSFEFSGILHVTH